ncbi:unnamed protein product [Vitrella brassicaformis CCMP3155]|uniref:Uncharacterized protein n=2 Tax=Vitrella brassicaformis TaxID=1169539 RepID=A0A0G4E967_VITBC|nr:unnamed protein product [Vitrella brassicaformis CCMP3155]|eukprot:CEL91772.1 unnamed protein product [Vitrella brassicaformis CCMP3155]
MRCSCVRLKADPALLVSKRLPNSAKRSKLLPTLIPQKEYKHPEIVKRIIRMSLRKERDAVIWYNLCGQAIENRSVLLPIHMAEILRACARVGYRHGEMMALFAESLKQRADVRSVVLALTALQKLQMPCEALKSSFLRQLGGNCASLSFIDLRHVLSAFASLQIGVSHTELLHEVCDGLLAAAYASEQPDMTGIDGREFLQIPYHLGRLGFPHPTLLRLTCMRLKSLMVSRIRCAPLDALCAYDGFLRLGEEYEGIAEKLEMYGRFLLAEVSTKDLLNIAASFTALDISTNPVWSIWADEVADRLESLDARQLDSVHQVYKLLGRPTNRLLWVKTQPRHTQQQQIPATSSPDDGSALSRRNGIRSAVGGDRGHESDEDDTLVVIDDDRPSGAIGGGEGGREGMTQAAVTERSGCVVVVAKIKQIYRRTQKSAAGLMAWSVLSAALLLGVAAGVVVGTFEPYDTYQSTLEKAGGRFLNFIHDPQPSAAATEGEEGVPSFAQEQETAEANITGWRDDELVFAVEICRHGARAPMEEFTGDKENKLNNWLGGRSYLTQVGEVQHWLLGPILRDRYVKQYNLLSPTYAPGEIYIRSSAIWRTVMSAQAQMAGLYPPGTAPSYTSQQTEKLRATYAQAIVGLPPDMDWECDVDVSS